MSGVPPAFAATTIAEEIAAFAADVTYEDLPPDVVERAKLFILDSVGVAYAATTFPFATMAAAAFAQLGSGTHPVIGSPQCLAQRDAAIVNGVLCHGLDYDDTHVASGCHASTSAFPLALAMSVEHGKGGRDLLLGYVLAVEVAARVAAATEGKLHAVGFHPTGVAGAFGCATAAARLSDLDASGIARAQGIVGSMAAGVLEFLDDGSWTKRLHPGLAAANGITAAALARARWKAPACIYEGRFGFYRTHIQTEDVDLRPWTASLGHRWEVLNNAVKPFPVCHFIHAFADAALALRRAEGFDGQKIVAIDAFIHPTPGAVVSYPAEGKVAPKSDYEAKFSLPYVVATTLLHGKFGLAELEDAALSDPAVLALATRVTCHDDPQSAFPQYFSGELRIRLDDGRELTHREHVNRGADTRPLSAADIVAKFDENAALVLSARRARAIRDTVLSLDSVESAAAFGSLLSG
ncbi:MAG TPA: MmgE/PrpD family protein [Gaiellaceae bacterium]|nr:MmgE/PrpD family protein [Gaiellaceae bacterium]